MGEIMKRVFVALAALAVLSSCAGSPAALNRTAKSTADFDNTGDEKLCHPWLDDNKYAREERKNRGLNCYQFRGGSGGHSSYVPPTGQSSQPMIMTTCRQSYGGAPVYCNSF
jgi:hypothetical protein